jgi:hypothetical protein
VAFTPAELSIWLKSAEAVDALATLIESGDLKLIECATGYTCLRTHMRDLTKLEIGDTPILPTAHE